MPDDQPDGIADDSLDLPDPARASERVNAFLAWWGDGRIAIDVLGAGPPLYARDLQALANVVTGPAALLNRLADLTDAAGRQHSTEWLRTCATLPPAEWPPAPAYRGPVVHLDDPRSDFAAMTKPQLRDLRLRIVNELRQRRGLPGDQPEVPGG